MSQPDHDKANPADPTSPPLADPLKQDAVTDAPPSNFSPAVDFIMEASADGNTEIQLSRLALQKSHHSEVRRFAQRIINERGRSASILLALATQEGTSVPSVIDTDHQALLQPDLSRRNDQFDEQYLKRSAKLLDASLARCHAASAQSNQGVADFARDQIGLLRADRQRANDLTQRLHGR